MGYVSGRDYIEIIEAGYYSISVAMLKFSVAANESTEFRIERYDSANAFQERIHRAFTVGGGTSFAHLSATAVAFFNAGDRLKVHDPNSTSGVNSGTELNTTSIYKLN